MKCIGCANLAELLPSLDAASCLIFVLAFPVETRQKPLLLAIWVEAF